MIYQTGYQQQYKQLFEQVFSMINLDQLHSVSLGPSDYRRNILKKCKNFILMKNCLPAR